MKNIGNKWVLAVHQIKSLPKNSKQIPCGKVADIIVKVHCKKGFGQADKYLR